MTVEYRYYTTKGGDFACCDSCSSDAPLGDFGHIDGPRLATNPISGQAFMTPPGRRLLCEVCASTFVGNRTRASAVNAQEYGFDQLAVIVAQVGNLILDKLTARNELRADAEELPPEDSGDD